MAVREELLLDLSRAHAQIDDLERQLDGLLQPISIPVRVESDRALDELRADIRAADTDDINIDVDATDLDRAERELEEMRREAGRAEEAVDDLGDQAARSGDQVERLGRRGTTAFSSLRSSLGLLLSGVAAFAGARELFQFFGSSIQAASDLEESLSKSQVVFGEFADDIETFADTAPTALLLSRQAALEFTATFGNLFTALGLSRQAAADLSPQIVQLGADLASFNNIAVDEALTALRSGLVGEVEPLRRLGVAINAASVEAKALELGLVGANGELSEAAKVQARWALIMEQTANAQGDVARTADSIANRQRNLAAEFATVKTEVGEALIPAFEKLLDLAPAVIDAIGDGLVPAIAGFAASIETVDVSGFISSIATLPTALGTLSTFVSSGIQAFGNASQIFTDLALLRFGDVGQQFDQLGEDLQNIGNASIANEALQNLIQTLIAGVDPAEALESTLVALGENVSGLTLEGFEGLVTQLVAMTLAAGGAEVDLFRLADVVEAIGREAGFSEAGVGILADLLRGPFLEAAQGVPPPLDEIANAEARLAEASADAAPALSEFEEAANRVAKLTFGDLDTELAGLFDGLPDQLGAAREALRDDENNIVTDFGDFLDKLDEELAAREAFADNIALLRALGFDDLADTFADLGLESAGALADGLTDPAALADAEARLEAFGASLAAAQAKAFLGTIEDSLTSAQLAVAIAVNPVLGDLDFGVLPVVPNLVIPGQPTGGTSITVNVESTSDPATDGARIAQAVGGAINVQ